MTFHEAILREPMMVFGPGKYAEHLEEYLGILIRAHFTLMIPGSLILIGVAFLLGQVYSASVEKTFIVLALAAPFILLLWLVRQSFYVRLQPGWSAAGGFLYCVFLLSFMMSLWSAHQISPVAVFIAMGSVTLLVSVILLFILRPSWILERSKTTAKMVFSDHWRYGRWSMATAGIMWLPSNIYYLVLPILLGLNGTGALKALMNLAMPALHSISALSILLLPVLVGNRKQGGSPGMARTMRHFLALFVFGAMIYLALLWGLRYEIFHFLYADKYTEFATWPLLLTGILPLGACLMAVFGNALRAMERPDRVFWCYLGSSFVALFAGIPLILSIGVTGALLGQLLSSLTAGALMFCFYRRHMQKECALGDLTVRATRLESRA